MKKIWEWVKLNPNRTMFLVPILLVAVISISHVVSWYNLANPISWAIYLSIAIEIGAMTALVAATNKIKGGVWFMFGLVTFIQMIGNIFFSYKEIDANGDLFKSWVELTSPVWESFGTDITDVVSLKRWLAFLEGGLLPIISLTSLHFFIKYEDNKPHSTKELLEDIVEDLNTDQVTVHDTDQVTVHDTDQVTVHDTIHDAPQVKIETKIIDSEDNYKGPEIEEMVEYESSRYFDIQEKLIPSTTTTTTKYVDIQENLIQIVTTTTTKYVDIQENLIQIVTTTTTTNDGVRRLTYSKSS
jgi:hypothetical protein